MSSKILNTIGVGNLQLLISDLTTMMEDISPVDFNEQHRYIDISSPKPGPMSFDHTPFWIEPLNNLDFRNPTRETIIKKGVQVGYTVALLESAILYVAAFLKTKPMMFATLDKEMAHERFESSVIPMFNSSGFGNIFQSTDVNSTQKKGVTKNHLQWIGGGYCLITGATNIDKSRSFGVPILMLDEVDATSWEGNIAGGGDKVLLFKKRCEAFMSQRKIFIGSTPLIEGNSRIDDQYKKGDQREYYCRCLKCEEPQPLRWTDRNENGEQYGFFWDMTADGQLIYDSIYYKCRKCGHRHYEKDKRRFINRETSYWQPTATAIEPGVKSYHVPSFLSSIHEWSSAVVSWLNAWDIKENKVKDVLALQNFYNNVLGEPFKMMGTKLKFETVSSLRRSFYKMGEIKNETIEKYSPSKILFTIRTVDLQKDYLAVALWGFTRDFTSYLIDYRDLEDKSEAGCTVLSSPAWNKLYDMILEESIESDDGKVYKPILTAIDSRFNRDVVVNFCAKFETGVFPIQGVTTTGKKASFLEFNESKTSIGTTAISIGTDQYKNRLSGILKRDWTPASGIQPMYTVNMPSDVPDQAIKELTVEYLKEKKNTDGSVSHVWYRPNTKNELWDLMVYAYCMADYIAWCITVGEWGLDVVSLDDFFNYCEDGPFWKQL